MSRRPLWSSSQTWLSVAHDPNISHDRTAPFRSDQTPAYGSDASLKGVLAKDYVRLALNIWCSKTDQEGTGYFAWVEINTQTPSAT